MIIRKPVREKPSMLVAVYQTALLRGTVEAEIKVGLYAGNQEAPKILPVRTLVLWIFDIGSRSDQYTSKVIKKNFLTHTLILIRQNETTQMISASTVFKQHRQIMH